MSMPNGFEWVVILVMGALYFAVPVAVIVGVVTLVRNRRDRRREAAAAAQAAPVVPCVDGSEPSGAQARQGRVCDLVDIALRARVRAELISRGLSDRETEALMGACAGKTFAALADEMGVTRSTAGTYCTRAYEKLGVTTKDEAVVALDRLAVEQGLLLAGLSEREVEVALLAADGASTADIAAKLVLSEATVNSHLQQAFSKLGVHSREELGKVLKV